jgi:hypothetical protein
MQINSLGILIHTSTNSGFTGINMDMNSLIPDMVLVSSKYISSSVPEEDDKASDSLSIARANLDD